MEESGIIMYQIHILPYLVGSSHVEYTNLFICLTSY